MRCSGWRRSSPSSKATSWSSVALWPCSRRVWNACASRQASWRRPRPRFSGSSSALTAPLSSPTLVVERAEWSSAQDRAAIDAALTAVCETYVALLPQPVADAVSYSLLGGGKRMRGLLLLAAYRAAGGRGDAAPLAATVEVVHAYSLIHDDLPCMDNEDLRRGRPTVHVAFGVASATAAGLAMVPLAVCSAVDAARRLRLPETVTGRIVTELMQASGAGGMIGGQLMDLEAEGTPIALTELERIHVAKTGALIAAAA